MKRFLHTNNFKNFDKYLQKTGAQAIYQTLLDNNVSHVFGYTGGAILSVTDTLYKSDKIEYIKNVNEQCMGHSAEGYAKVTNKPEKILFKLGCIARPKTATKTPDVAKIAVKSREKTLDNNNIAGIINIKI